MRSGIRNGPIFRLSLLSVTGMLLFPHFI
jgi:hypothetical protein